MNFRLYNKETNLHICDCEYFVNNKGDIYYQYLGEDDTERFIQACADHQIQYSTGLFDVTGKEIFEGDWVYFDDDKVTRKAQVVYSPKVASFVLDTSGRHLIDEKYGDYRPMHYKEGYKIVEKP
jgi:hypothetical protein